MTDSMETPCKDGNRVNISWSNSPKITFQSRLFFTVSIHSLSAGILISVHLFWVLNYARVLNFYCLPKSQIPHNDYSGFSLFTMTNVILLMIQFKLYYDGRLTAITFLILTE